jgi:hypothetical protein
MWDVLFLGSHIPSTNVDEVSTSNMLNPKVFMEKYMLPRKPLVFRGVAREWPAFEKWTDSYLKENYPDLELRMEGRKEKQSPIPQGDIALGRDSMRNFLETYHNKSTNKYIVSELPTPLYKYVNILPPLGMFHSFLFIFYVFWKYRYTLLSFKSLLKWYIGQIGPDPNF